VIGMLVKFQIRIFLTPPKHVIMDHFVLLKEYTNPLYQPGKRYMLSTYKYVYKFFGVNYSADLATLKASA